MYLFDKGIGRGRSIPNVLFFSILLLISIFQKGYTQGGIVETTPIPPYTDVEVSISTPTPNIGIWKQVPVTVTIQNTGPITATNVEVTLRTCSGRFPWPSTQIREGGIVFANTNYQATKGTFSTFPVGWSIPDLVEGESATLTVHYFTLTEEPIELIAYLTKMDQDDIDSAPTPSAAYRNQSCEAPEDDEALLIINPVDPPTVCEGDVKFTTQAAFDAYFANCFDFPIAREYTGSIILEGPDITNLDVLGELRFLEGDFSLINTSVKDLGSVLQIDGTLGGHFTAEGNPHLKKIGLGSITGFKDDASIIIRNNASLEQINLPFDSDRIHTVAIHDNPRLQQITGRNLYSVENLTVGNNRALSSFSTQFLREVTGNLGITFTALSTLNFEYLSKVNGQVTIGGHPQLTAIDGLTNLKEVGSLTIADIEEVRR